MLGLECDVSLLPFFHGNRSNAYKRVSFMVHSYTECGTKTICLEFSAISKRPFGYKQTAFCLQATTFRLQAKTTVIK